MIFGLNHNSNEMVIEWLKVNVSPELRETYVQKDAEIWTPALSRYSGFLGKEVWISPDDPMEVVLIIRWESLEAWQSIPGPVLEQVEAEFAKVMGNTYKIVDSNRYQVRKFLAEPVRAE